MSRSILNFWARSGDDHFAPLFDTAPILMHSIDPKGVLINVSAFWAERLGYRRDEMIGRRSTEFLTEASQRKAASALPEFFRSGKVYNIGYDFIRKDGETVPVLMSAVAQYDSEGAFQRSLAIMFDNSEVRRIAQQLSESQKTATLGRLVGGVAHDFNNLLTVIQGNLEYLRLHPFSPERDQLIEDAYHASRRGAATTAQLLAYARRSRIAPESLNVSEVVKNMGGMLRRSLPESITLTYRCAPELWPAKLDKRLLETAVLNLTNNARDAVPRSGGAITVETRNIEFVKHYPPEGLEEAAPGRYVMLAIIDNGAGVPEDVLSDVFEPFFTTKPVGAGLGLGLSMVQGFVDQSKGFVRLDSAPAAGTVVKLYFPAVPAEDRNPIVISRRAPRPHYAQAFSVLLVEDEPEVRKVIARQLSDLGLRVSEAASGDEAFQSLLRGFTPDVLVTDMVMPGRLQGPDLAREARALIKGLKIAFISGYPREAEGPDRGFSDLHLVKPVSEAAIASAIEALLGPARM